MPDVERDQHADGDEGRRPCPERDAHRLPPARQPGVRQRTVSSIQRGSTSALVETSIQRSCITAPHRSHNGARTCWAAVVLMPTGWLTSGDDARDTSDHSLLERRVASLRQAPPLTRSRKRLTSAVSCCRGPASG